MQSISIQGRRLLQKYKEAWESQDPSILDHIFLPDATYYYSPFEAPLRGIDEIRLYWNEKVAKQSAIAFRILNKTLFEGDLVFDWTASFIRADRGLKYRLQGVMRWRIREDRVASLWEYYVADKAPTASANKITLIQPAPLRLRKQK